MTNQQLNIPKTIHVGYQNRSDTYTKKLAYVIYTDQKGKVRKETSWNSWRDNKIDPDDFDNEPTSGFVLNKGVGGARGSWSSNTRNEYIRVYDPRGFEFEISVANLLFVLTECNAYKGKGIEGEFVYAWGGTELVLLPVGCSEYKESSEFTSLQSKKVTKKDMNEGWTYQHKNTNQLVYLGRHKIRGVGKYSWNFDAFKDPDTFRHVFYDIKSNDWHFEKGFTKLAQITSQESYPDYADLYTKFTSSKYVSEFDSIVLKPITTEQASRGSSYWFYIKVDEGYQLVSYSGYNYNTRQRWGQDRDEPDCYGMTYDHFWPLAPRVFKEITKDNVNHDHDRAWRDRENNCVSRSYIEDKELFTAEIKLKSNETVGVNSYVQRH